MTVVIIVGGEIGGYVCCLDVARWSIRSGYGHCSCSSTRGVSSSLLVLSLVAIADGALMASGCYVNMGGGRGGGQGSRGDKVGGRDKDEKYCSKLVEACR